MNTIKKKRERIGRMMIMHANQRETISFAKAGDIVAIAGLKNTTTGDTLALGEPLIILEKMEQKVIQQWKVQHIQILRI